MHSSGRWSKIVRLELPDTLVEEEFTHLMHELEHRLSHERMTLDEYAEYTNQKRG